MKNRVDFFLRSRIRAGLKVPLEAPVPFLDANFQKESEQFLNSFPWDELLARFDASSLLITADIGARNFCLAPIIDQLFMSYGHSLELHGIEIDAYRRLTNFRTRKNYGDYYAKKIRRGDYHAMDFLEWRTPLDVAFLLNPFVTESPTLAWGLPLSKLKPRAIFQHLFDLVSPKKGFALVSSPSEEEIEIVKEIASSVGFYIKHETLWVPDDSCVQKKPRYGVIVDAGGKK